MNNLTKNFSSLALALSLSACAMNPPIYYQCPPLGINTDNPDFRQHYNLADLDNFYTCTSRNLDVENSQDLFGYVPPPAAPWGVNPRYTSLAYQWNLWQQVHARELTPLAAEQSWIKFVNELAVQREQIRAARAAEEAAEEAAWAAQAAADAANEQRRESREHRRKNKNRKHDNSGAVHYTPSVPTPNISTPSADDVHKQVQQQLKSQGIKWH